MPSYSVTLSYMLKLKVTRWTHGVIALPSA